MKELFRVKDLIFYKEEFLDNIQEFEDIISIVKDLSSSLTYEKIEVVGLNDCCEKTSENYIIEIQGFLNKDDDFYTKEEIEMSSEKGLMGELDIFVIRIYKCLNCNKWIIDILE
ncbi:MAG: hypothetical protein IJO26_04540 [Clostridium sp.]|nr:hypothetical protein [Clostridium sp.]